MLDENDSVDTLVLQVALVKPCSNTLNYYRATCPASGFHASRAIPLFSLPIPRTARSAAGYPTHRCRCPAASRPFAPCASATTWTAPRPAALAAEPRVRLLESCFTRGSLTGGRQRGRRVQGVAEGAEYSPTIEVVRLKHLARCLGGLSRITVFLRLRVHVARLSRGKWQGSKGCCVAKRMCKDVAKNDRGGDMVGRNVKV